MQIHQSHVYVCVYASMLEQEYFPTAGRTHVSEVESHMLWHGHLGITSLVEASMTNIYSWRSCLKQNPYTNGYSKEYADKIIQAVYGRVFCVIRAERMLPSAARVSSRYSEDTLDILVGFS